MPLVVIVGPIRLTSNMRIMKIFIKRILASERLSEVYLGGFGFYTFYLIVIFCR